MANFNIDYLVVAGGGAGKNGGGGAGGMRDGSENLTSPASIDITVGAGGEPVGTISSSGLTAGWDGEDSEITISGISTITSTGGGQGGRTDRATGTVGPGGSGGGGGSASGANTQGGAGNTPATSPVQGYDGGGNNNFRGSPYPSGGGGGAGAVGGSATSNNQCGSGGAGRQSSITGTSTYYAGGGGGGMYSSNSGNGVGGIGGGGDGYQGTGQAIQDGATNTGGGGGGGGNSNRGGYGGSGVVILRYATADANYTTAGLTPTETTDGTDTILSFTTVGTGTITFSTPPPPPFSGTKVSNELLDLNQQNNEIGLRIPVGDDANEPTPDVSNTGSIRYNTDHQALSISNGTGFELVDSSQSLLPTVTLTNSWRAWDTASFTNGAATCTDVTGGLVLGPYSSGSPGAFFYGSFNNVVGNKYWVLNGGGSHGRRAGFTRPTEFTVSYWGNKPNDPGYNSERAIWTFNAFGSENIRLARRNNAGTSSLRIYSGNSSIATFADGITTNTWYNITLTFSLNTVKTYVGVQGSTNTTLINTTTLSSGNFPTGILNSNGTGFWIGTNSGYTDWLTDSWSGLNIYDGVARQAEIDTIVSNGYQQ